MSEQESRKKDLKKKISGGKDNKNTARRVLVLGFCCLLLFFLLVGFIPGIRPTKSIIEKRELAKHPSFDAVAMWKGDYFQDVLTWYADTFPQRERMIGITNRLESLYGLKGEEIITRPAANQDTASATDEEEDENLPDGSIHDEPEAVGNIYIADNRGFGIYYFSKENIDAYTAMINRVAKKLGKDVNVIAMPNPDNYGVILDKDLQIKLGNSYEGDAFDYFFEQLDKDVTGVNCFPTLVKHNSEYVYFYTDHHWTARGAYYAYRTLAKEKGWKAHKLSDYEEVSHPGFLGTFYAYSNQSPALASNPDTIYAYIPIATNTTKITGRDGRTFEYPIIQEGETYDIFIGSDQPFEEITNPKIKDGERCLLIKDSYGNCFAPFLVDHYEKVYVVDFRHYHGNLTRFIKDNKVDDVIIMNNIEFATGSTANTIEALFP